MDVQVDEKLVDGLANEYASYFKLDTTPQVGGSVGFSGVHRFRAKRTPNQISADFGFEFFKFSGALFQQKSSLIVLTDRRLCFKVKLIEECIEENLTHLEEFCTMLDKIRNESNGYLTELVPELKQKKQQLRTVYAKIDKLLELVDIVKSTVDSMESELAKAEAKFASSNKFSRFFSSLLGSAGSSNVQADSEFQLLHIYSTKDFFDPQPAGRSDSKRNDD